MNTTTKALISRGIGTELANKLVSDKWTINKLKLLNLNDLKSLGFEKWQADALLDEKRPPIPNEILINVLYASAHTCCICKDPSKGIIVHHIESWSKTKDHSFDNLAPLCLDDHDKAHSKKDLSINLTSKKIREFRDKWYDEVKIRSQGTKAEEDFMPMILTGMELVDIINGCSFYQFDLAQPLTEEEGRELSIFEELLKDWGDLLGGQVVSKVEVSVLLYNQLKKVINLGFVVFGKSMIKKIKYNEGLPKDSLVANITVVRQDNPRIKTPDLTKEQIEILENLSKELK